jgi:hypothetical protein
MLVPPEPGNFPAPGYPGPGYASEPYPEPAYDSPALAVPPTGAPPEASVGHPYSLGASLSANLESGGGSSSVVSSPLVQGRYVPYPRVVLGGALGLGWLVDNQGLGQSTFRAGNPYVSGHYVFELGAWRLEAGLGVTLPLAHVTLGSEGRLQAMLYNRTLAMWGMWDPWQWLADHMAVPLVFRATYALPGGTVFLVEAADALLLGVRSGTKSADSVGQMAVEAQWPIGALTLCPRLQTVLLPSGGIDRWQSAAGLRGSFKTGIGRLFVGVLVNLDEPIGAQPGLNRWGFHFGKEVSL